MTAFRQIELLHNFSHVRESIIEACTFSGDDEWESQSNTLINCTVLKQERSVACIEYERLTVSRVLFQ